MSSHRMCSETPPVRGDTVMVTGTGSSPGRGRVTRVEMPRRSADGAPAGIPTPASRGSPPETSAIRPA